MVKEKFFDMFIIDSIIGNADRHNGNWGFLYDNHTENFDIDLTTAEKYLEQNISQELEQLMEDKEIYTSKENSNVSVPITKNDNSQRKYNAQVVYPIISNGDTIGTVILLSKESNTKRIGLTHLPSLNKDKNIYLQEALENFKEVLKVVFEL